VAKELKRRQYWKSHLQFHPSIVGTKVNFSKKRGIGVSYCRILLDDTMLNGNAFRTCIADTCVNVVRKRKLLSMYYCDVKARSIVKDYLSDIFNNLKSKSKQKRKIETRKRGNCECIAT